MALLSALESVGCAALAALEGSVYGAEIVKNTALAASGKGLLQISGVLEPVLALAAGNIDGVKLKQVPLRQTIHLVLAKWGSEAGVERCEVLAAAIRVAIAHCRRLHLNEEKMRQASRFLDEDERVQLARLCSVGSPGGPAEPPRVPLTLHQIWSQTKAAPVSPAAGVKASPGVGFDKTWDPTSFAAAASAAGGPKALAQAGPQTTPRKRQAEESKEPCSSAKKGKTDTGKGKGKGKPAPKFFSKAMGRLSVCLGAHKSEICSLGFESELYPKRVHIVTVEERSSKLHRQVVAALVRLAVTTEVTADELRAIMKDRVRLCST
jgi:hypothetical protein